jgi:4-aminobutyrate aminotransferase-like enzyme
LPSLLPPHSEILQKLTKAAFARNLLIMGAGARESIRILPPLNVTAEEVDTCLNKLEDSMAEVLG